MLACLRVGWNKGFTYLKRREGAGKGLGKRQAGRVRQGQTTGGQAGAEGRQRGQGEQGRVASGDRKENGDREGETEAQKNRGTEGGKEGRALGQNEREKSKDNLQRQQSPRLYDRFGICCNFAAANHMICTGKHNSWEKTTLWSQFASMALDGFPSNRRASICLFLPRATFHWDWRPSLRNQQGLGTCVMCDDGQNWWC